MNDSPLLLNVDDDRASQYAVNRVLREAGYDVLAAASLGEATAVIRKRRPDLVLLDVNLPDGSGLDLCAQLKREYPTSEIMVLQHSATFATPKDHARGLDYGADGYVTLPAAPEMLLATVRSLLRAQRAERATREIARQWEATFHALSDGVVLLDPHDCILNVNGALAGWLGRPAASLVGRAWIEVCADLVLPGPSGAEPDGASERDVAWRGRWLRQVVNAVSLDDSSSGRVCVLTDISERKAHEHERTALLAAERAARLRAEEADRAKEDFLALVSHELRTPLSAVMNRARVLTMNQELPEDVRQVAASIERSAQVQAGLIEDLLDVSRTVSGQLRLDLAPLDLNDVVRGAEESASLAAAAKGVSLEVRLHVAPLPVSGDAGRLRQVVWNLASNAVKFTPAGGHVAISLSCQASEAVLRVADNGIGVDPAGLPHVFTRFWHASRDTSRRSGLGLGLAIVQHLVEAHGGRVEAESAGLGYGTTFIVTVPLLQAPA
ncbi:MAG TPA: ATP-binding protein [Luteitalea sp.]|nr:ATP-binding protein [Luteitalea sp.]